MASSAAADDVDAVVRGRTEKEGRVVDFGRGVEERQAGERVEDGRLGRVEDVFCVRGQSLLSRTSCYSVSDVVHALPMSGLCVLRVLWGRRREVGEEEQAG